MEAAVVARPDEKWGETPCAFITLKPDAAEPTADALASFCRQHLAGYKVPKHFVFTALPKTRLAKSRKPFCVNGPRTLGRARRTCDR